MKYFYTYYYLGRKEARQESLIMSTNNAESHIAGWFCIYCEEDFDTEQLVDLHLAGDNRCSIINYQRKHTALVQDTENPNHYYTVFNDPESATTIESATNEPATNEPATNEYANNAEPAAYEHVVSKSNDMFNKIKDLIIYGFCMRGTQEEYSRNTRNAYTNIKELLQDTKNTLSQKDDEELRHIYSFITNDVHGYYPSEDCHMFNMLRTATII